MTRTAFFPRTATPHHRRREPRQMAYGGNPAGAWGATLSLACVLVGASEASAQSQPMSAMQWHAFELAFSGPTHSESQTNPNPFLDYRLQCRFTAPSSRT